MKREVPSPQARPAGVANRSLRSGASLRQELEGRLRRHLPGSAFTLEAELRDVRDNLVPGVDVGLLPRRRGLERQLRRVESPLVIALNSFAPWQAHAAELELAGQRGFTELRFHLLCPTGVRGTPPVVAALARGAGVVVAIEALAFDYLQRADRRLAGGYRQLDKSPELAAWWGVIAASGPGGDPVRHLALARLVKLALALQRNFSDCRRRLLYLFLEPPARADVEPFARHRRELAWLAQRTRGAAVEFAFASFPELWEGWERAAPTPGLREHARHLLARYRTPLTEGHSPVLVHRSNP